MLNGELYQVWRREKERGLHNRANEETCEDSSDPNRTVFFPRKERENEWFSLIIGRGYFLIRTLSCILLFDYFTEYMNFPFLYSIIVTKFPNKLRLLSSLEKEEEIITRRGREIPSLQIHPPLVVSDYPSLTSPPPPPPPSPSLNDGAINKR